MRISGKITHWNTEKGYGFITPESNGQRVFVHISAFHSRIPPPKMNQAVSFLPATDKQGRPRAEQVLREGESPSIAIAPAIKPRSPAARTQDSYRSNVPATQIRRDAPRRRGRTGWGGSISLFVAVIAVAAYSYYKLQQPAEMLPAAALPLAKPYQEPAPRFRCDGRTHCSHMTSCEEANYFIQNCPNTKMDGDGDGVPCESQWCG